MTPPEAPRGCPLCPRLVEYRRANAAEHADWWNAPAPSFGDLPPGLETLALPLPVSGQVVAVLYADQGPGDPGNPGHNENSAKPEEWTNVAVDRYTTLKEGSGK